MLLPKASRVSIADVVRAAGGVVRSRGLRELGWSDRALTNAVAQRSLIRPRNGWLAVPDADSELIRAARAGVRLTCVTQARRLGLWVLHDDAKPHVAASRHAGRVRIARDAGTGEPAAVVHWSTPLVPRVPGCLVDPIENVLATVAACLPFEEALAIWDSALNTGLVDLANLNRLPLSGRARRVAQAANPFMDSGLETFVLRRLKWLRVRIAPQAWLAGHRVDFLIGDRLILQIDGSTHTGAQRDADNRHDAALMLLGYHVIRVGYAQVVHDWPGVQDLIMRAIAQGLHRAA